MKNALIIPLLGVAITLLIAGCDFDFPLTANPTRPIEDRLIGNWIHPGGGEQKSDHLGVRQLDEFTYIVAYNGDLYRAFHSDFGPATFLSVQDLNPAPGRYLYLVYQLSSDGSQLRLKPIDAKTVLGSSKDQAGIEQYIKQNLNNPKLFGEELLFRKE